MTRIKPRTLSGFMELSPEKQALFERVTDTLRRCYCLYGFTALDTPVIESAEVLLAKGGGETEKQIYRFSKGDGDLALRFDLTVPLAKYVAANYGSLSFPFRRYQIGKVYRGERAQRGRFREFYQADIDIIGDGKLDIINEAEIPAVIYRAFSELGLKSFKIKVNNRKLLSGAFELIGVSESSGEIMRVLDKLDKIGSQEVRHLLTELGLSELKAGMLLDFISISGDKDEVLGRLAEFSGGDNKSNLFSRGYEELKGITRYLSEFGVPYENFEIDLTIARGLDYYTGTVYETKLSDYPEIGSVCSGGRYDDLASYYTDKVLPGVGISIGLTRLFYVLDEQGLFSHEPVTAPCDVLLLPMTEDLSYAVTAATALRNCGIRTALYREDKKFKVRLAYASKLKIPFVLFLGEDEIKSGELTLKNLLTGEQRAGAVESLAKEIKAELERRNSASIIREREK